MLKLPNDYIEMTIAITGNVDSGKSSLCGVLTNDNIRKGEINKALDDGNGLARRRILNFQHEQKSGRTSSISYNYMICDNTTPKPRIVSLVDLAGHQQYLKTTITGVVSSYPDHGLVLISKNITHMTREHYSILASLGIPILFILNKIDIVPKNIIKNNIKMIETMSKKYNKKICEINTNDDVTKCINDNNIFGYIKISNKTGEGIQTLIKYIEQIKKIKKIKKLVKGFCIDTIYNNIKGFGVVVSGITGIEITEGETLKLGPFKNNEFISIKIRSIHNDYKEFVHSIKPGIRGCLCIKIDDDYKKQLRKGLVICKNINEITSVKTFTAYVAVFRGQSANIRAGYNSFINIGLVKGGIIFKRFRDPDTLNDVKSLIPKKHTLVDIEFMNYYNAIKNGDKFLFRSGRTQGIGKVIFI